MSFRELRNFAEIMRALGYPRHISMESFRSPNFDLVADALHWLVTRYDPTLQMTLAVSTEQERIQFLKLASQTMYSKARLKLNSKKLYSADGYAVKELLKMATLLYDSMNKRGEEEKSTLEADMALQTKMSDLKQTRNLATEITSLGSSVYDLLGSEVELREARQKVVAKAFDADEMEQNIKNTISSVNERIETLNQKLENLAHDESNLGSKIDKKKVDLERHHNRLKNLQSVRPAFMDDYEKLEVDLGKQYSIYLEKFRNLEYLENELEVLNRAEYEKYEESQKALKKIRNSLRAGAEDGEEDDEDADLAPPTQDNPDESNEEEEELSEEEEELEDDEVMEEEEAEEEENDNDF